jgi:hypothetical protein
MQSSAQEPLSSSLYFAGEARQSRRGQDGLPRHRAMAHSIGAMPGDLGDALSGLTVLAELRLEGSTAVAVAKHVHTIGALKRWKGSFGSSSAVVRRPQ